MARMEDLVVNLKLNTRQFDRSIRRVQRSFWWLNHGWQVVIGAGALLIGSLGFVLGIVLS